MIEADTAGSGEDPQSSPGFDECYQRYLAALLCLQLDDPDAYRKALNDLRRRFEAAEDAASQNFVAWTACLAPAAVADYSTVLALAEKAVAAEPENDQFQKTLAAARFRSGQYESAHQLLTEIAERDEEPGRGGNSSPAYGWYFLAMTEQALGNLDDATEFLNKANDWTNNMLSDQENPPSWNRKLTLELLRDEATGVITPSVDNQAIQSAEESTSEIENEQ